jgi:hypothetical protein
MRGGSESAAIVPRDAGNPFGPLFMQVDEL